MTKQLITMPLANPDNDAKKVLQNHQEAIVIYIDKVNGGEKQITVLTKLDDRHSKLAEYLTVLLSNLKKTIRGKRRLKNNAAANTS